MGRVDKSGANEAALEALNAKGPTPIKVRQNKYLNNVVEQDHCFIKKRIAASLWFRSVEGAVQTVAGYEAMHAIRKGQIRWLPKGDVVGQVQFIQRILGIGA